MNDLTFTDKGFSDYVYWQSKDRKTLKKINSLLEAKRRFDAPFVQLEDDLSWKK